MFSGQSGVFRWSTGFIQVCFTDRLMWTWTLTWSIITDWTGLTVKVCGVHCVRLQVTIKAQGTHMTTCGHQVGHSQMALKSGNLLSSVENKDYSLTLMAVGGTGLHRPLTLLCVTFSIILPLNPSQGPETVRRTRRRFTLIRDLRYESAQSQR